MLVRSTGYNTGAQDIIGIEKDDDYRPLGLPRSKKVVGLFTVPYTVTAVICGPLYGYGPYIYGRILCCEGLLTVRYRIRPYTVVRQICSNKLELIVFI